MKESVTGYKANSKDKNEKQLFIKGPDLTMTNVPHKVEAQPVYPNGSYGMPTVMLPGVSHYSFPGAVGVIETKLPKAQKGKKVVYNDPKKFKIADQAYRDSTNLYNLGLQQQQYLTDLINHYGLDPRYTGSWDPRGVADTRYHNKIAPISYTQLENVGSRYANGISTKYYRKADGSDFELQSGHPLDQLLTANRPIYKKPQTQPVFEELPDPQMIGIRKLPVPGENMGPQLQNIPIALSDFPQKQRVTINTPQGDKIRVQDPKTKKFMWWEDEKGLPTDIENPTGIPQYDFKYMQGGSLPKAQTGKPGKKKKNPIFTSDPNNLRLKQYNDSLDVYNLSNQVQRIYPDLPQITKDKYDEIEKKDDALTYWDIDEVKYKEDKKNKKKNINLEDYIYSTREDAYDDPRRVANMAEFNSKFSDDPKAIDKFIITLPNGDMKIPHNLWEGKPDWDTYTLVDAKTNTSRYYGKDYNGKYKLHGIFSMDNEPIETRYYGKDVPVKNGSVTFRSEEFKNKKLTKAQEKQWQNYNYETEQKEFYEKPTQPVIYKRGYKGPEPVDVVKQNAAELKPTVIPYKGDPNRRTYPITSTGDEVLDRLNQQLFGNTGILTDNSYIPFNDPKYNPYVGGIGPRVPEMRTTYFKFADGGELPKAQLGIIDNIFKRRVLNQYPVMKNVYGNKGEDLNIIRDRNFDASSHGFGDIEFIYPGTGTVQYTDDYSYQSPTPDKYTSVYNPKGAGRGDVFLDMLHGMRNDPGYMDLLQKFGDAVKNARGKDMQYYYEQALANNLIDDKQTYDNNYIDGMLRAHLYPYTPGKTFGKKDYDIEKQISSPEMYSTAMDIYNYLNAKPQKVGSKKQGGSLYKAQKGLSWTEYLNQRGITDKDMLALTQDQINQGIDILKKQEAVNGKYDIKNDVYNNALENLVSDYNKVYPLSNDGSRGITPNIINAIGTTSPVRFGLTDKEIGNLYWQNSLDPALNQKYIDAYFKGNARQYNQDLESKGNSYRDVPVKWVDAYPKNTAKGFIESNPDPEAPGQFRGEIKDIFRTPILYDDQVLGKQDVPLLGAKWMRDYYDHKDSNYTNRASRDHHTNPAIYPKPNYSIQGAEPVPSGVPNWGSSATINGQGYTLGAPTQNSNFDQYYGLPASSMPGASAENVFVDTPTGTWMQNYKNKMHLYDITQQNLARLKEYDPNYRVESAPLTEADKRVVDYEQQYINNPDAGFYQVGDEENYRIPCKDCGTLHGSTSSSDANNYYQTYDVQYPQKGIFSKTDLDKLNEGYYLEPTDNPGVAVLHYRRNDGNGNYTHKVIGPTHARDWLNDEQQAEFFGPKGGVTKVDYNPDIKIYPDMHSAWKVIDDETFNPTREKQKQKLKENTERIEREKEMLNAPKPRPEKVEFSFEYGGETDSEKPWKDKYKSMDGNYVTKTKGYDAIQTDSQTRRTLKGFIQGAPKPTNDIRQVAAPSFAYGGSLPKAQKGKEWESLGYANRFYNYKNDADFFDSHARLDDNPRYNQWLKDRVYSGEWEYNPITQEARKVQSENKVAVSPETKTLAKDVRTWTKEEKVKHPESTYTNLPKAEVEQLRKENTGFNEYVQNAEDVAAKQLVADESKKMAQNPMFYSPGLIAGAAALPALGEAFYNSPVAGMIGTALTSSPAWAPGLSLANTANAGFITHGVSQLPETYRAWDNAINNGGSYSNAIQQTALNAMDLLGAGEVEGFKPALKYMGEGLNAAAKYPGQLYNDVATGNSIIPYAWKSPAVGLSQGKSAEMFKGLLNSGELTPAEKALVIEYQSNSRPFTGRSTTGANILNVEKRNALNDLIKKYNLDVNSDAILTRRFNFDRGNLGSTIDNGRISFGDRPTSFSAGVGTEGYAGAPDRLVVPNRYVKNMGDNLLANPYGKVSDETLNLLEGSAKDFALNAPSLNQAIINERELIGTGLDFKQIGKVKNDIGGFDYIVKPTNLKGRSNTGTTAEAFSDAAETAAASKEPVDLSKLPNVFNTKGSNPDNLDFRRVQFKDKEEPMIIPYVKGTNIPFHKVYRQNMVNYFNSPQFHTIMDLHYPGVDKELYKKNILKNLESPLVYDPNFVSETAAGNYYPHRQRSDIGTNVFTIGAPKFETKVKYANSHPNNSIIEGYGEQAGNSYVNSEYAVAHEYRHQATNSEELLPESLTKKDLLDNLTPEGKTLMEQQIAENKKYRVDNYYSNPTEFDVRMRRLKEDLKENGIVDYFNEPITEEHVAQLLEKQNAYDTYNQVNAEKLWQDFKANRLEIKNNPNLTEAEKKEAIDLLKEKFEKDGDALEDLRPAPPKINKDTKDLLRYWSSEFLANKANMLPAALPIGIGIGVATQEKKKGGNVNKRNNKALDDYFTQAWASSRKSS